MPYLPIKDRIDYSFGVKIFFALLLPVIFEAWNIQQPSKEITQEATFGLGCFWHSEEFFLNVRGVEESVPGYSGGNAKDANYKKVSTGKTGHAEVVNIRFNPKIISYKQLLEMFFGSHDPTTLNRQDPDVGPQYRSVIFYHNAEQKTVAEKYISELNSARKYKVPIVTQLVPFRAFYKAESYHNRYYRNHPDEPYIRNVTKPQVEKFKRDFKKYLKTIN